LSAVTDTQNSFWLTLVRSSHDPALIQPDQIMVNPHNTAVDLETGPLCHPMSIIQNLKLNISMLKSQNNSANNPMKLSITPFFCAFANKYDAADDDTGITVATIMSLTKDATNKDVVPLSTNNLPQGGGSDLLHPLSTVNDTEVFGDYNYTTDMIPEDAPFDMEAFQKLRIYGTNKGALNACLGRTRYYTFDNKTNRNLHNLFIRKFVPRSIRRITEFVFFGLLFHMPIPLDIDSYYQDTALTGAKSNIGIKCSVRYDEWNDGHDNSMDV